MNLYMKCWNLSSIKNKTSIKIDKMINWVDDVYIQPKLYQQSTNLADERV